MRGGGPRPFSPTPSPPLAVVPSHPGRLAFLLVSCTKLAKSIRGSALPRALGLEDLAGPRFVPSTEPVVIAFSGQGPVPIRKAGSCAPPSSPGVRARAQKGHEGCVFAVGSSR
jgi:hypothetical protein